nr:YfiR family protein [Deltaproteobacteria bacterium]
MKGNAGAVLLRKAKTVPLVRRDAQRESAHYPGFNFIKFTEWPESAFSSSEAPITIGIVGDNPFGEDLDTLIEGKRVRGRTAAVERFRKAEAIDGCLVLFIAKGQQRNPATVLEPCGTAPCLP